MWKHCNELEELKEKITRDVEYCLLVEKLGMLKKKANQLPMETSRIGIAT